MKFVKISNYYCGGNRNYFQITITYMIGSLIKKLKLKLRIKDKLPELIHLNLM